ncbi:zinc finger protein Xfin-like [Sergentomyia squamirostris]
MGSFDLLGNSKICRLCGENNTSGYKLFNKDDQETSLRLIKLINEYLPVKVKNDGKFPRWICPGCNIQVEATVEFFDLIISGQEKLREMYKMQKEQEHKDEDFLPNTYVDNPGMDFIFPRSHGLSLKARGVEKVRRKRGRPPKPTPEEIERKKAEEEFRAEQKKREAEEDRERETAKEGKRRRRVRIPARFDGVVQGKELEKVYVSQGVIDKTDISDSEEGTGMIENATEDGRGCQIIGHLKSSDGMVLSDLVVTQKTEFHRKGRVARLKTRFMCDICNKTFSQELRFLIHRSTHQNVRFECTECLEKFVKREILKKHQNATGHRGQGVVESVEATDSKDESIPEEVAASKVLVNLQNHDPINEIDDDLLNIPELEAPFSAELSFSTSNLETQATFAATKKFSCQLCKMAFGCLLELRQHMTSHQPLAYFCDICQKRFNDPALVVFHKELDHSNIRRFACSKCDKQFMLKHQLQRHQNVHQNVRPFECSVCKKRFKTKPHLQYHALCHSQEKRYGCEICDQRFHHSGALKYHKRWHSGHRPFKCNYCGKSFLQSGILKEHIRVHTNERPFKCTHCQMSFKTISQCKMHIQRHTKPQDCAWVCEVCGKAFIKLESYKIHMRRHRNEKIHVCDICQKSFAKKYALKKHSRTHSGEKPFRCNICGKSFADGSNMVKHRKLHNEVDAPEIPENFISQEHQLDRNFTENSDQEEHDSPPIVYQILNQNNSDVEAENQIIFVTYPVKDQLIRDDLKPAELLVDGVNSDQILTMENIVEPDPTNGIFSTSNIAHLQLETGEDYRFLFTDK